MVPFNQVLKLVARLDSQCLANLPWNGCLSLTRYRGMLHRFVPYIIEIPYIPIMPYFASSGKRLLLILKPQCGQCDLRAIPHANRLSNRELSFHLRSMSANRGHRRRIDCQYLFASSISEAWITPPNSTRKDTCSHV